MANLTGTDVNKLTGITNGTQAANKCVVTDTNTNIGITKVTQLHIGTSGSETQVTATATQINTAASSAHGVNDANTSCEPSGAVSSHSGLSTGVHGVGAGTVAKVSDIATDANLSVAAQAVVTAGACDVDGNLSAAAQAAITASHAAVTLATDHGLSLSTQTLAMGTPSSVTGSSTNAVSTTTHTHALDLTAPPAIGETTPNTVRSYMKEITKATSGAISAAEIAGTIINNYGQAAANVALTLPAAAAGYNFIAQVSTTQAANTWKFTADTNDKFYLDGIAGTDNQSIIVTPAAGDFCTVFTFKNADGNYDWIAKSGVGAWTAGA